MVFVDTLVDSNILRRKLRKIYPKRLEIVTDAKDQEKFAKLIAERGLKAEVRNKTEAHVDLEDY